MTAISALAMDAGFISKGFYGLIHDNLSASYDELSDHYDNLSSKPNK